MFSKSYLEHRISSALEQYDPHGELLIGIGIDAARNCFIKQIRDSVRRIRYMTLIEEKGNSEYVRHQDGFNPIKVAANKKENGFINEAFWLVFLSVHFGKNKFTKWKLASAVYNGYNCEHMWDWDNVVNNVPGFRDWLHENAPTLREIGKFGSHRKRESIRNVGQVNTGEVVESYINWINGDHINLISKLEQLPESTPFKNFQYLYDDMNVFRFARMGKFDYLCTLGKLKLLNVEPEKAYLKGSTGALQGAKLLLTGDKWGKCNIADLEDLMFDLYQVLGFSFGMQILEDALCNWQKSPSQYKYFDG